MSFVSNFEFLFLVSSFFNIINCNFNGQIFHQRGGHKRSHNKIHVGYPEAAIFERDSEKQR